MDKALKRIRMVADYQFGKSVGEGLFPKDVEIALSKRTGRIRYIFLDGRRLATMRPNDGFFSLSIDGAKRIVKLRLRAECFVAVRSAVSKFVVEGSDVFAAHVVSADDHIRARDEVIVLDNARNVLAVGRAVLSGEEMVAFKRGVAVKVRRGSSEES